MAVLVEFLTCLLETASRTAHQFHRQRHLPDEDSEFRTELRLQMLKVVFVESSLVPQLFKLLHCGVTQFESVALLRALLTSVLNPNCKFTSLEEPLLAHFLPHVDMLGALLRKNSLKAAGGPSNRGARVKKKRELKLNAYTVLEPLGALPVAVVQILAQLSDLAPERTLAAIKPAVWGFLVQSFFAYRCNHIFQNACQRLFVAVIKHGSTRLQELVLQKQKLLANICEVVLAEGACGDFWHTCSVKSAAAAGENAPPNDMQGVRMEKSQVSVGRKRHPGGLGGITPVVAALLKAQRDAADEAAAAAAALCTQKAGAAGALEAAQRMPLAPCAGTQAAQSPAPPEDSIKSVKPVGFSNQLIARFLAEAADWTQVVDALSRPMPKTRENVCPPLPMRGVR